MRFFKHFSFSLAFVLISSSAFAEDTFSFEGSSEEPKIAQWVKDGEAITDFPVCYQLWKCNSQNTLSGESILLPKGEWGLCGNYASLNSANICQSCDAPSPTETCE